MEMKNVREKKVTMTHLEGNLAVVFPLGIMLVFILLFNKLHGHVSFAELPSIPLLVSSFAVFPAMWIHELLHAGGWMLSGKTTKELQIGSNFPICLWTRFDGTMKGWQLLVGVILPFVTLSVVPAIIGLVTGNIYLIIFAFTHASGCGSDFVTSVRLLKYLKNTCADTEGEIGFKVLV